MEDESGREESLSATDSERNVIDWSNHHPWYSATTISIAEDFENRISAQYKEDPAFAEALKSRLQGKFSFILPFLEGDCETLFEDPNLTSTPQGSDASSSTSNYHSNSSQSQVTSSSRTSFASTTLKRQESGNDDGDEVDPPQDQRRKRRKPNNSREDLSKRRRLRCHFHAFCPEDHTQKTCMVSGWLNIHNLRLVYPPSKTHF